MELLMPFQSEKQRRYLWANEPKIARDWTEKYGSRVKKDNGGIMDAWGKHATATNSMKLMNQPDYHQKAGYNFMQNFPNTPNWLANTLATGYQYGSEGFKALKGGTDFSDAMARAKEESRLNKLGIQGLGFDMGEYENFMQNYNTANEISPALQKAIDEGTSYSEFDKIPNEKYFGLDIQRNYVPTGSMNDLYKTASLNQSGNYIDPNRIPGRVQRSLTEEEDEDGNFIDRMRKYTMPAYNFMRGKVGAGLMGLINPLAGLAMFSGGRNFNRNRYMTPNQNYMKQRGITIGRDGRMVGGAYAGLNAPGTSMFGSKTFAEMANKQLAKYGKTASQAKVNTWNRDRGNNNGGNQGGGGGFGKGNDPGGGAAGSPFNRGGLASLWQR